MTKTDDDRCTHCIHRTQTYGKSLCTALSQAIPVESARHPKGRCGPDASLFDAEDHWDEDYA